MPQGNACLGSRCRAKLSPPGTCPSPRLCVRRSSTRCLSRSKRSTLAPPLSLWLRRTRQP
eukprot:340521-Pleurochrysis_carterae.AAC.1